jgi:hypothetical protein
LQAVGKVDAGEACSDNDDVVVDVASTAVLHDGGVGMYGCVERKASVVSLIICVV